MKSKVGIGLMMLFVFAAGLSAQASTVAYWRFEEGPAGAPVSHGGMPAGVYYEGTADSSGNGYGLSVWAEGWAGYAYRSEVGISPIPQTGQVNQFSVKNTGGYPAMFTSSEDAIRYITPSAFTIEATFKLENGGYRTIVGRDSYGTNTAGAKTEAALAALYFQAIPNNALAIKFCDVSGYWHEAISAENIFTGFDYPTNPDGVGVPWYSMAAVSDGSTLSLYLLEIGSEAGWQLIAQTDMTASGSPNTALTAGLGSGSDWEAGNWSVGRGLYNGGHTDRAYGFLDEIRISDSALSVGEFLIPEPASLLIAALGSVCLGLRRKSC
ncbi:MAG TPA: PEP-CTERM sorting domain-containing protein [Anaerohalosphaeraceae bacterium]|nr:PEP-CTERM sorting domain-containing protein [Anaerohalosphaeraceae bacterium]HRT24664.1 PEP-CTERM sorting domain-containing protein [Anaerohalosphaeraceae bacterium]HRU16146.1 PEP-CTERM sorting domain-containing protein [Anaerohalosphaeraceae bacterium]